MPMEKNCKTCNGPIDGYKCDACGFESLEKDGEHLCDLGGKMLPKCAECDEVEAECVCE